MKVFDPLRDINVVSDTEDTAVNLDLSDGSWYPELYEASGSRSILVFYSSSTGGPYDTHAFSIEYGHTTDFPGIGSADDDIYQSTYRKYALQLLDSPDSKFTYIAQSGSSGSVSMTAAYFISFNRAYKFDEIRKQGFVLGLLRSQDGSGSVGLDNLAYVYDEWPDATNRSYYRTLNGDYDTLYWSGSEIGPAGTFVLPELACGQIWYQPGVIILDASSLTASGSYGPGTVFITSGSSQDAWMSGGAYIGPYSWSSTAGSVDLLTTATPAEILWGFWDRLYSGSYVAALSGSYDGVQFLARQELFYQDFYCRAHSYESNYSSNPTYVDASNGILVADMLTARGAHTYITTIGLYDNNENLLGVAKLSRPVRKDSTVERLFRVRLVQ